MGHTHIRGRADVVLVFVSLNRARRFSALVRLLKFFSHSLLHPHIFLPLIRHKSFHYCLRALKSISVQIDELLFADFWLSFGVGFELFVAFWVFEVFAKICFWERLCFRMIINFWGTFWNSTVVHCPICAHSPWWGFIFLLESLRRKSSLIPNSSWRRWLMRPPCHHLAIRMTNNINWYQITMLLILQKSFMLIF